MNVVLKSFGQAVAFGLFDAALSIFFDHEILYNRVLIDAAIFFVAILLFNIFGPKLKKLMGFEDNNNQN